MLGFIYRVFLSRVLSTAMLGVYTIALSVFGIFNTLLASGTPLAISRLVSIGDKKIVSLDKDKSASKFVVAGCMLSASLALAIVLFIIAGKPLLDKLFTHELIYKVLLILIPAIISTGIYTSFRGYMYGREKYLQVSVVELIEQILRMGITMFIMVFLYTSASPEHAGIGFSIAAVISTTIGIFLYFKVGGRLSSPKNHFKPVIASSVPITAVRLGGSIVIPVVSTIIPLKLVSIGFKIEQALSVLGIMVGMTLPLLTIPGTFIAALSTALIPRVAVLHKEKKFEELNNEINTSMNFSIVLTFLVMPVFAALGEPICELIFNSKAAGTYLSYACWIMLPMNITHLTSTILNALGLEFKCFWIYIISSVFLFASILFLPALIGIHSIIIGMGLSAAVSAYLNFIIIKKNVSIKQKYFKNMLLLGLLTIPISLLTSYSFNILSYIFPFIIALGLAGGIAVVAYLSLLVAFNLYDIKTVYFACYNKIKNKTKPAPNKTTPQPDKI